MIATFMRSVLFHLWNGGVALVRHWRTGGARD
jgi:hypothetical protein